MNRYDKKLGQCREKEVGSRKLVLYYVLRWKIWWHNFMLMELSKREGKLMIQEEGN